MKWDGSSFKSHCVLSAFAAREDAQVQTSPVQVLLVEISSILLSERPCLDGYKKVVVLELADYAQRCAVKLITS